MQLRTGALPFPPKGQGRNLKGQTSVWNRAPSPRSPHQETGRPFFPPPIARAKSAPAEPGRPL